MSRIDRSAVAVIVTDGGLFEHVSGHWGTTWQAQNLPEKYQYRGDAIKHLNTLRTDAVMALLPATPGALDPATVERCAQIIRDWFPDEEAAGCDATWADCKYALLHAVSALATDPHQHGGKA